jgi:16S rRNA (cytidine1402-2'-O)-methyltransferase
MTGSGIPVDHADGAPDPNGAPEGSKLEAGLYVVATPIGNLGDVTARARAVLAAADVVACEDTRVTGRLLERLGVRRPLVLYNDHQAPRTRPALLARLRDGGRVALVSDAGTPCISDPGYRLVREAHAQGTPVRAVPGASSVVAALSIAGLPTDRFLYLGFLPPKPAARRAALATAREVVASLVLLEAPGRLVELLADAEAVLGGGREAAVARELTKRFEEVRRGTLGELARTYAAAGPPKGEVVLVVGPPEGPAVPEPDVVDAMLREAAQTAPPRAAAAAVAKATGLPANRLYARLLELRRDG